MILKKTVGLNPLEREIALIFESNGSVAVKELCHASGQNERQLQRLFQKYVGLSPKYYNRIIRFNNIFKMLRVTNGLGLNLYIVRAIYDQSHFIRDFKCFTGEDPSRYGFSHMNIANFFLNK